MASGAVRLACTYFRMKWPLPLQVPISIWVPQNLAAVADNPTLSRLLPDANRSAAMGCSQPAFQATTLRATADFVCPGRTSIIGVDVSSLVTFSSSSSQVAVSGTALQVGRPKRLWLPAIVLLCEPPGHVAPAELVLPAV